MEDAKGIGDVEYVKVEVILDPPPVGEPWRMDQLKGQQNKRKAALEP